MPLVTYIFLNEIWGSFELLSSRGKSSFLLNVWLKASLSSTISAKNQDQSLWSNPYNWSRMKICRLTKSSTIGGWYRRILWKNNSLIKRGLFFFVISKILNIYGKYGNKNITEFQEEEDSLTFFQLPDYLLLAVFAPLRW